jgi:hypothetical protein
MEAIAAKIGWVPPTVTNPELFTFGSEELDGEIGWVLHIYGGRADSWHGRFSGGCCSVIVGCMSVSTALGKGDHGWGC